VQKWSDDTLKEIVSTFKFEQGDTVLKIVDVKNCKGDAEVNVRKGKKLVTYDYNIKLGWELNLMEKVGTADAKTVGTMEGTYEFPEVSNDEEEDGWECNVSFGKDEQKL
jgi:activator of HSP90 ATPase